VKCIEFKKIFSVGVYKTDIKWFNHIEVAKADGLLVEDFRNWFKVGSKDDIKNVAVIYFNIDRRTKKDRRRFDPYQKIVEVPYYVVPKQRDLSYMNELAGLGYNIQKVFL
jgi:hypothetical protein